MFSIIIPVGPERNAETALSSLRSAGIGSEDEVLLIGDGHDVELTENFDELPLRLLRTEKSEGANHARNLGVESSRNGTLCFLDDDDAYFPQTLTSIRKILLESDRPTALSLGWQFGSGKRQWLKRRPPQMHEADLWKRNFAGGCSSMVVDRELFEEAGRFDAGMQSMQDWDLWIRLSRIKPVTALAQKFVLYHDHKGQRISTNREARIAGLSKLLDKHSARWPKHVIAFHQSRLAGEKFAAKEGSLLEILNPSIPILSFLLALKYLCR